MSEENRLRLAKEVRASIERDFGAPLLAFFSERTARAVIDGYVLRLVSQWDEEVVTLTQKKIATLRTDAAAIILFDLHR